MSLDTLKVSIERLDTLVANATNGGLSHQSVQALNASLAIIDRQLGKKGTVSLEAIPSGHLGRLTVSIEEAQKLIGERKSGLLDKAKEIIQKILAKIKEYVERFKAVLERQRARIDKLREEFVSGKRGKKEPQKQLGHEVPSYQPSKFVAALLGKDGKLLATQEIASFVDYVVKEGDRLASAINSFDGTSEIEVAAEPYSGKLGQGITFEIEDGRYNVKRDDSAEIKPQPIRSPKEIESELDRLGEIDEKLGGVRSKYAHLFVKIDGLAKNAQEGGNVQKAAQLVYWFSDVVRLATDMVTAYLDSVDQESAL